MSTTKRFDFARSRQPRSNAERVFGLRIEGHVLQLAIATRQRDGVFDIEFDELSAPSNADWLASNSSAEFANAIRELAEKHQMRRCQIAVSLDGDYCVTRVVMGTPEHIDKELEMLLGRATRYLSLGPGEKIAGITRTRIGAGTDYVAAAVANEKIVERIYHALLSHDMHVQWIEPSLVSIARLIDDSGVAQDEPLLIADGTGSQWDLGIVHCGRLLLDYRPAAASNIEEIRSTTESHIGRLRRFCSRHRNIVGGTLSKVLVVGADEQTSTARAAFESIEGLSADNVRIPMMPSRFRVEPQFNQPHNVPAIAAILPLVLGTSATTVPDLLSTIRREANQTWRRRLLSEGWPGIAAAVLLMCGYIVLSAQRAIVAGASQDRAMMETQMAQRNQQLRDLTDSRQLISHLKQIDDQSPHTHWPMVIDHLSHCLADDSRINQFQYDDGQGLRLDGSVQNESGIYDFVGHLRRVREVKQVALQGTSPMEGGNGANFRVLIQIESSHAKARSTATVATSETTRITSNPIGDKR